jgi:hypothetical protein
MNYSLIALLCWLLFLVAAQRQFFHIALLGFPGVIMHESMHLIVGLLLLAKPVSMNLIPRRSANKWLFGSVSFTRLNLLNAAPVAYAPLLLLGVAWLLFNHWMVPSIHAKHYLEWALSGYITACAAFYSLPSFTDIKVGGWSTLFWGLVGLTIWWFWAKSGLPG